jgi:hypothetical protein
MLKNDYIYNKRLPSLFLRLFLCTISFYRPQNQTPLKEHYNEHYETVVDELNKFYKKRLLELPEKLDGFYLDHDSKRISHSYIHCLQI